MNDYIFRISTQFSIKWYAVLILFLIDTSFFTLLLYFAYEVQLKVQLN